MTYIIVVACLISFLLLSCMRFALKIILAKQRRLLLDDSSNIFEYRIIEETESSYKLESVSYECTNLWVSKNDKRIKEIFDWKLFGGRKK